jgi:hypothetical protein
VSIDLLNASSIVPKPVLENIAHNLNSTELGVNVTWPYNIPNETATYQLYFIATTSGSDIANSGNFNLTLPPGENRTQAGGTVGPYGTHPDTDSPPGTSASASGKLSKGAIAGVVFGAVGAAALSLGALVALLSYRRKRQISRDGEGDKVGKPELDGSSSNEKRDTLQTISSVEIGSSDKPWNYLQFELPSSAPKPPAELPDNEIPAFEMSTGTDTPTLDRSKEHGNIDIVDTMDEKPNSQSHTSAGALEGNQDPMQPPHSRNPSIDSLSTPSVRLLPSPSLPNSPSSGSLRSISPSSSSPRRAKNFAQALEEIIAEEFRRTDPE